MKRQSGRRVALSALCLAITFSFHAQPADTTAFMRKLLAVEGVSEVQPLASTRFAEKYVLYIQQPVDHQQPEGPQFAQRVIIGLKGDARPTVLVTEGYFAHYAMAEDYEEELTRLLDANMVVCEYRYFGESVPEPCDWSQLTVDNSLADYHHLRQAFAPIFTNKWISTGISKGGQTTMFYRATYPTDMDISVSYVAPLNRDVEDGRHEVFLSKKVATKAQRKQILAAEQELMRRKERLLPQFEQYAADHAFTYNVSAADIYDFCVMELPFALWQWGTGTEGMPTFEASDSVWFDYYIRNAGPEYFSCPSEFTPFFVQAARELGYYGYACKGLKKWQSISTSKGYLNRLMLPAELRGIDFDPTLYERTVNFLKANDPKQIFIYGELDPWSASGVLTWLDCSQKENMRIYVEPGGCHKARISTMPQATQQEILSRLNEWLSQ